MTTNDATIKAGARVCFEPATGNETVLPDDLLVTIDAYHVNGTPGVVFNGRTAYCLDLEHVEPAG